MFVGLCFLVALLSPLAVVRAIYAFVGLELPQGVQEKMQGYLEDNRREKRPAHSYAAEHFGLSAAGIAEGFAAYRQRYLLHRPA